VALFWVSYFYCYVECRYAECRYAERRYAECRYTKCRYAECRYAECLFAEGGGTLASSLAPTRVPQTSLK